MAEALLRYLEFAKVDYQNGPELVKINAALRLLEPYYDSDAAEFDSLAFEAI